jgi:bifunctional UDP-N-acetylglucosamine pyrophosphorylase / glucosamine-1-phosphate N-acetyltransferase
MKHIGAIILAGGKGTRMKMETNKVTAKLADKPMVQHIVEFMHRMSIETVVVVVGYAKESVIEVLDGKGVIFAEQTEQLGTGHAVAVALEKLPEHITDVLVVYGDDAVLYAEKHIPTIQQLFAVHEKEQAAVTFLSVEQSNPFALGRVVRDEDGKVTGIIEEKDATDEQRKITEINPGCFLFSVSFLREHMSHIERSPVTGEYYINNFIDIAIKKGMKVEAVRGGNLAWRGVNTVEELEQAETLFKVSRQQQHPS